MQKSGEYLSSSIQILNRIIQEQSNKQTFKAQILVFNLRFMQVKSFLQHAAILSQLVEHSSALTQAIKAKEGLKLAASSLYSFISQKSKKEDCPTWNSSLEVMLEKFIYEITNRDPTNASNQTSYKTDMILKHQTSGIIFWKHNPRNNEKYLKKELAKRYGENFKGKKMQAIWLEEFNIGNIMHLNPVLLKELEEEDLALSDILNEEKLVELVLVYSCCLFSVATENRFICHKELETDKKSNELNGPVNIVAKNYQLLQNNNFRQSEIYHFKAIEILCSFISDCPLLNHFLASYHKNYTPNLESIVILVDQPEESIHSPSASKGSFLHQEYLDPRPRKISSTLKAKIDHQKLFMLAEKQLETNQEGNKSKDKNQIMKKAINRMNFKEIMKKSKENQTKAFLKSKMDTSKEKGKPPQISSRDQKPAPVHDTNQKGLIAFSTKPQIGSSRRVSSPPVCKPINTSNRIKKPSPSPKQNAGMNFNRLKTFDTAGPCSASRTIEMPSSFSGIFSKKPNPNLVGVKECTRESSRKSSLGKKKQYSKTSEGDTRPQVNIKIENKDFIAKLMNINIIKIKPDLKNNQCYCRTTNSPNKTSSKISKDRRSSNTKISGINNIAGEKHVSVSLEKLLVTSKSTARNKSAGNQADNMVLRKKGYNLIGVDSINTKKISKTSSNIHKTSEINRNYTKDSSRISSNDKSKGLVTQNEISIVNNEQGQGNKPSSNQRLFSLIKNMHDSPLTDRQFRPMKRKPTIPVTNEGLKENIRKALEAKHRR